MGRCLQFPRCATGWQRLAGAGLLLAASLTAGSASAAERTVLVRSWTTGQPAVVQTWEEQRRLRDDHFDQQGRKVMVANWSADGRTAEWQKLREDGTVEVMWTTVDGQRQGDEVTLSAEGRKVRRVPWVNGQRQGLVQDFDAEGQRSAEVPYSKDKPIGPLETFYPSGQRRSLCPLVDHQRHGVEQVFAPEGWRNAEYPYVRGLIQGVVKFFDMAGALTAEVPYRAGKVVGPEVQYHPNGKKRMVVPMTPEGVRQGWATRMGNDGIKVADMPFEAGKLHGWERRYGIDGAKSAEVEWRDGQACCGVKTFWSSGALQSERGYVDAAEDGTETRYHDRDPASGQAGHVQFKVALVKGQKQGVAQVFERDGVLRSQLPFHADLRHGKELRLYPDASKQAEYQWQNDRMVGIGRTFWPNGQLQSEFPAEDGAGTGLERRYTAEGKLRMEVPLLRGKKHGEAKLFDAKGQVLAILTYADDLQDGPETRFRNGRKIGVWVWQADKLIEEPKELAPEAVAAGPAPEREKVLGEPSQDAKSDADLLREEARQSAQAAAKAQNTPKGKGKAAEGPQVVATVHWPNGKLRSVYPVRGRGAEVQFHDNGEVALVSTVVNGIREGLTRYFDRTGALSGQVVYVNGAKDGDEVGFGRSGEKIGVYPFRKGQAVGVARTWYRDGALQSEFNHDASQPAGVEVQFHRDGQVRVYVPLRFGNRHGTATIYDDHGRKWAEVPWLNGKRHGDELRYSPEGKVIARLRWDADKQAPAPASAPAAPSSAAPASH